MPRTKQHVSDLPPFALLQDDVAGVRLLFAEPQKILVAHDAASLELAFGEAEQARRDGKWLAGYVSYEAGYMLEAKLAGLMPKSHTGPLILFGIFDNPDIASFRPRERQNPPPPAPFAKAHATWTRHEYAQRFNAVRRHLALGDIYQANLTFPLHTEWQGDPVSMFATLVERQPVRHGAIVHLGGPMVLSRSPELFFEVDADGWIETRPMKGTAKRGKTADEDEAARVFLANDPKNQSENRMIVDLLRNDISRITEVGTLSVPELFKVETYPSLHQMISRVRAKLLPGLSLRDMFAALFPCGSITARTQDPGDGNHP